MGISDSTLLACRALGGGSGSNANIADAVSSGQDIGILVDSYSGSGSYTVSVEELGQ